MISWASNGMNPTRNDEANKNPYKTFAPSVLPIHFQRFQLYPFCPSSTFCGAGDSCAASGMASLSLGLCPAAVLSGGEALFSRRRLAGAVPSSVTTPRRHWGAPLRMRAKVSKQVVVAAEVTDSRPPKGIAKPRRVSPEMQELVGVPEIPRTQALKLIWAHIKEHNLQDPENKKIIVCDEKLKKIFGGRDRVGFLEISGLINPHFLK